MQVPLIQIDAFAEVLFEGNPLQRYPSNGGSMTAPCSRSR
jgi:predicted PhzF superfamily epimerase YddE/YHI9